MIREPESLPYRGEYRGLDGAKRRAVGWLRTWSDLQPRGTWKLGATFHDAGDKGIARWRLRARTPGTEAELDTPMVGVYRLRDGKLVALRMFDADTAVVVQLLADASRAKAKPNGRGGTGPGRV